MRLLSITLTVLLIAVAFNASAQFPMTDLYQYNYNSLMPTFAGQNGTQGTLMGSAFRPDRVGDQPTLAGYLGFEMSIPKLNGAFTLNSTVAQHGPYTDTYTNLGVNYQFKIDENQKIIVGAKVGVYEFVIYPAYELPLAYNDPAVRGAAQSSLSVIAGGGALYRNRSFYLGMFADNVLDGDLKSNEPLKVDLTKPLFHYVAGIDLKHGENFESSHSLYGYTIDDDVRADINSSIIIKKWAVLGASLQFTELDVFPKANAGVRWKNKGQFLFVLYSNARDVDKKFGGQFMMQFRL